MAVSMYDFSIPVFRHALGSLALVLGKGQVHCANHQLDESVLFDARLYPDMFPLHRQVQVSCDQAKNASAYLAGETPVGFEDTESTFADLIARIEKTRAALDQLGPELFTGMESEPVSFVVGAYRMVFPTGLEYLQRFALPNFYFHVSTAYDILRHNGVELGKGDFLGEMGAEIGPA
ncbi:MAG: hypothetical protein CMK32_15980 [Porticoccaceae bacterium]|nr:hypothetical protein [Porticoccaceae bacterium]